jgi:hypothetical protein
MICDNLIVHSVGVVTRDVKSLALGRYAPTVLRTDNPQLHD